MKRIEYCMGEDSEIREMLKLYRAYSRFDTELNIRLYEASRFERMSTSELAEQEYLSRATVLRRIKEVDSFLNTKINENK